MECVALCFHLPRIITMFSSRLGVSLELLKAFQDNFPFFTLRKFIEKHEKHPQRSVTFSKVALACNFTKTIHAKSNTLQWVFFTFLRYVFRQYKKNIGLNLVNFFRRSSLKLLSKIESRLKSNFFIIRHFQEKPLVHCSLRSLPSSRLLDFE